MTPNYFGFHIDQTRRSTVEIGYITYGSLKGGGKIRPFISASRVKRSYPE
jgi:hypothetical protein